MTPKEHKAERDKALEREAKGLVQRVCPEMNCGKVEINIKDGKLHSANVVETVWWN